MNILERVIFRIKGKVVRLKTNQKHKKGSVLISYITVPFRYPETARNHFVRWECVQMSKILLRKGYDVDVIDYTNKDFIPKKDYTAVIDLGDNLERFLPHLKPNCLKILHLTGAHYSFQNNAEQKRINAIYKKRGVLLTPQRVAEPNNSIEHADIITMLGNDFTESTYAFANKKIIRLPSTSTSIFEFPQNKDIEKAKHNFVWIGGAGMAHKGLDLVLEAFAQMPKHNLFIYGKKDPDFAEIYKKELFETPNIHYKGFVDIAGKEFTEIAMNSIALIYPSCSEGCAGSVVSSMHAGLIPITSYESGVDIGDGGIILKENTVEEIMKQIKLMSSLDNKELKQRSKATWDQARNVYSEEAFIKAYEDFVNTHL